MPLRDILLQIVQIRAVIRFSKARKTLNMLKQSHTKVLNFGCTQYKRTQHILFIYFCLQLTSFQLHKQRRNTIHIWKYINDGC